MVAGKRAAIAKIVGSMVSNALRLIQTARLRLTPVELDNLELLWHVMREPDLREYQDIPRVPLDRFSDRITSRSGALARGARGRFEWLVSEQQDPRPIGWVSIRFQDGTRNRGELGYSILVPWRGQGYASEAVGALTDHIFTAEVVDLIEAFCMPENAGSRGVLRHVGLLERERLRRGAVVSGTPVDVLRFDIPRRDWLKASGRQAPSPGASNLG